MTENRNRKTLTLKQPQPRPKPKGGYTPMVQRVGKPSKIHLVNSQIITGIIEKVHVYDLELADGSIIPKHAILIVQPVGDD